MSKEEELRRIAEEIERCPLCRTGGTGRPVPGEGSGDARVVFVGEAPGKAEAMAGRPFIGKSGRFLRAIIRDTGLGENEIFITSPVHYLPLTRRPAAAAIEHGRIHLLQQINVIRPRIVVLLGNTACRALLQKNVQIAREHGSLVEKNGITHLISFHPAYAGRFPEGRKKFLRDFAGLKTLLHFT